MNGDQALVFASDDYHGCSDDKIREQRKHRDIQSYPNVLAAAWKPLKLID
jgi:hypothetical protein